ncbi:MAG: hypothetical protein LBM13_06435 [Candidatus Ancillula sp.]|jgi:hypothetical protein|nr:hypothetical protein [Candidatus Ancillula sp.]
MKNNIKIIKFMDDSKNSIQGLVFSVKKLRFWIGFGVTLVVMSFIVGFFQNFQVNVSLFSAGLGFNKNLKMFLALPSALFPLFGYFYGWLFILALILQAISIGELVVSRKLVNQTDAKSMSGSGISALVITLGLGCPACGTSLLAPLLVAIFASAGLAVLNTIGTIVVILAIVLCFWSIRRLGLIIYLASL